MSESSYIGGCFCERLRYRITGTPRTLCFCHCESCRRAAGAPFVAWGTFALADFHVDSGKLSVHASSPGVTRGFCHHCGSQISYAHSRSPEEIDVTLATLTGPAALAPRMHIWVEDKLPWIAIGDDLPRYQRFKSG